MTSATVPYRGYEITSDGSPFIVDNETVYIQHDLDADCYYGPFGYRSAKDQPLDAAKQFIDFYLNSKAGA